MAIEKSSLSIALQGFADFLADNFSQDVVISIDSLSGAQEKAKGDDKAVLNIYCYRLQPSGIHGDLGPNDPLFLRASVLITAFSSSTDPALRDAELRVLGRAMSVLSTMPVLPVVLPASGSAAQNLPPQTTFYRLQAVLQAPPMEEMNHIWSIQGGDMAYKLSAVYELALIPLEPLTYLDPPTQVESVILDVRPEVPAFEVDADGKQVQPGTLLGPDPLGIPPKASPPWLPFTMFKSGDALRPDLQVAPGASSVDLVVAGPVGEEAEVVVNWTRSGGASDTQAAQNTTVLSQFLTPEAAATTITLDTPAAGDSAVIVTRASKPDAAPGNTLTLTVGAP